VLKRITREKAKAIAADAIAGLTDQEIAIRHNTNKESVRKLRNGKTHTNHTGIKPGQIVRLKGKLSPKDVAEIKYWLIGCMPVTKIAEAYGVSKKTINEILSGTSHTQIKAATSKPQLPNRKFKRRKAARRSTVGICDVCQAKVRMPCHACKTKKLIEQGGLNALTSGEGPQHDDPSPEQIASMCKSFLEQNPREPAFGVMVPSKLLAFSINYRNATYQSLESV